MTGPDGSRAPRAPRALSGLAWLTGLVAVAAAGTALVAPADAAPPRPDGDGAVVLCRAAVLDRLGHPAARVAQAFAYHERTGFRVDGVLATALPSGGTAQTAFRCGVRFDGTVAYAAVPPAG